MKRALSLLIAGLSFGAGLVLSGMTQPGKIIAFLDVTGAWDPSLAFVMIGAIAVHAALRPFIVRRERPRLESEFERVKFSKVDGRLVVGSAIFGVGWGLGGYCPGPALVALGSFTLEPLVLSLGMLVGMVLFYAVERAKKPPQGSTKLSSVTFEQSSMPQS